MSHDNELRDAYANWLGKLIAAANAKAKDGGAIAQVEIRGGGEIVIRHPGTGNDITIRVALRRKSNR